MNFATKKAYFPTNRVIKQLFVFHARAQAKILTFICESISIFLFRSLFFLISSFFCQLYRLFCMELWLAIVLEKGKFSLQRIVGKQRSWQRIFPQIITFFVSIKTTTAITKFF